MYLRACALLQSTTADGVNEASGSDSCDPLQAHVMCLVIVLIPKPQGEVLGILTCMERLPPGTEIPGIGSSNLRLNTERTDQI